GAFQAPAWFVGGAGACSPSVAGASAAQTMRRPNARSSSLNTCRRRTMAGVGFVPSQRTTSCTSPGRRSTRYPQNSPTLAQDAPTIRWAAILLWRSAVSAVPAITAVLGGVSNINHPAAWPPAAPPLGQEEIPTKLGCDSVFDTPPAKRQER